MTRGLRLAKKLVIGNVQFAAHSSPKGRWRSLRAEARVFGLVIPLRCLGRQEVYDMGPHAEEARVTMSGCANLSIYSCL